MKDRIAEIIKHYDLSASEFAASIKVQPAVVSHVLSGRNKPSLDFVTKVVKEFPDISYDWLFFGKGQMEKQEAAPDQITTKEAVKKEDSKTTEYLPKEDKPSGSALYRPEKKRLIRLILLYEDGTFDSLDPASD